MSWMISQKCFKEFITLYNEMVYIESCCLGMQGDTGSLFLPRVHSGTVCRAAGFYYHLGSALYTARN